MLLLLLFVMFGVGFVMWLLGVVLIGNMVDWCGWKVVFILIIVLMMVGIVLIVFIFSYVVIGVMVMVLVVFGCLL